MKELPSAVAPDERITRYLVDKKHFKPEKDEIKVDAFLPPKPKPELPERQTSVYRTINCEETEIWSIGDRYVENREKNVLSLQELISWHKRCTARIYV